MQMLSKVLFLTDEWDLAIHIACCTFRASGSVERLATSWMVQGSNPGRGEIFSTHPQRPWGLPSLVYNGYRVIPGGKAARVWR
jgi:hypothetical protein